MSVQKVITATKRQDFYYKRMLNVTVYQRHNVLDVVLLNADNKLKQLLSKV